MYWIFYNNVFTIIIVIVNTTTPLEKLLSFLEYVGEHKQPKSNDNIMLMLYYLVAKM